MSHFVKLSLLLALALSFTGCSSFQLPTFSLGKEDSRYTGVDSGMLLDVSVNEKVYMAVRQAAAQNRIVLHVLGDSDPIRVLPLPNEGHPVTITDLLRQSGASEKIGSMTITLIRWTPTSPNGIKMNVRMSRDGKSVTPETDYTLQPGDRIQLAKGRIQPPSSLIGEMLGVGLGF